jgi:hypothetical protein
MRGYLAVTKAKTAGSKPSAVKAVDHEQLIVDERYVRPGDRERLAKGDFACIQDFGAALNARAISQPEARAALTIQRYEGDRLTVNALMEELQMQIADVEEGNLRRPEAMLVAQAHTLDAMFCNLARRSQTNVLAGQLDAAERFLRLALRAQSQAVRTIEVLSELKNPRPVAYVRQANISNGPQQVNNGIPDTAPAQGNKNEQNKLLDASKASSPSGGYSPLEALGKVDRAAVRRR